MVWYKHPIFVAICACILPNIGGFLGSLFTDTSKDSWYDNLIKPSWNPSTKVWICFFFKGKFLNFNFFRYFSQHGQRFTFWSVLHHSESGTNVVDSTRNLQFHWRSSLFNFYLTGFGLQSFSDCKLWAGRSWKL